MKWAGITASVMVTIGLIIGVGFSDNDVASCKQYSEDGGR